MVTVSWSKTIQFKQKDLEIPLFSIPGSLLCPVSVLRALLRIKAKPRDPLFLLKGGTAMTYSKFHKMFKSTLKRAGYNQKLFSSHSMRRGGTEFAHRSGVPESLIKIQGDWSSDAYKRYLQFPVQFRALVNLRMREKIVKTVQHF